VSVKQPVSSRTITPTTLFWATSWDLRRSICQPKSLSRLIGRFLPRQNPFRNRKSLTRSRWSLLLPLKRTWSNTKSKKSETVRSSREKTSGPNRHLWNQVLTMELLAQPKQPSEQGRGRNRMTHVGQKRPTRTTSRREFILPLWLISFQSSTRKVRWLWKEFLGCWSSSTRSRCWFLVWARSWTASLNWTPSSRRLRSTSTSRQLRWLLLRLGMSRKSSLDLSIWTIPFEPF